MNNTKLGCLTMSGSIVTLLTTLVILVVGFLQGGVLFNPGALNAQAAALPLGGIHSHAEIGGDCHLCHAAPWDGDNMGDRCKVCHTDLADDPKNFHNVMLAQSQETPCHACHTDHNGAKAALTIGGLDKFPHDASGYSLAAHRQHANGDTFLCSDCHKNNLNSFDVAACQECHTELDSQTAQAHFSYFGADCLACHDGLDTFGQTWDHSQAIFPLAGKHLELGCNECHTEAKTPAGLAAAPQTCFACHAEDDEHGGAMGSECAVCHTPSDWEQIIFDHSTTDFALIGGHREVVCERCHTGSAFVGTPQDCYSCHSQDDEHNGQFGQDCALCHTPSDWDEATFDHSLAAFPLTGKHTSVECQDCHTNNQFKGTAQDCYSCHSQDDEHDGQFGQDCALCHTPEDWEAVTFDHSLTNFPLTGAHTNTACDQCHSTGTFAGTSSQCNACHGEPAFHAGMFSASCADCHSASAWTPATFNGQHTFPINHGEEGFNACRDCHTDTLAFYTCYTCHDSGEVASKHREEGISNFNDCMECHPNGEEGEEGD